MCGRPASTAGRRSRRAVVSEMGSSEFIDSQSVREYLLALQQRIVDVFERLDGSALGETCGKNRPTLNWAAAD